jgi:hypothetical protein
LKVSQKHYICIKINDLTHVASVTDGAVLWEGKSKKVKVKSKNIIDLEA